MEAKQLLRVGWRRAGREWVSRKHSDLADDIVWFFALAFRPITCMYPEQTYFGVHSTRISLCVGNIWLAAFSGSRQEVWLLVERSFRDSKCKFVEARCTDRYMPLSWLVAPAEQAQRVLQSHAARHSYAAACQKVLEAPISQWNIPKNQTNKVRLSDLVDDTNEQSLQAMSAQDVPKFPEGGIWEVTLELRTRNPSLRRQAIAIYGCRCQVCGLFFEEFYGDLGRGHIEVHLKPLSDREAEEDTSIDDVAVVCANCHRILHRHGKVPILVEDLRGIVQSRRKVGD